MIIHAIILMGVSGSGKTTIGVGLAKKLGWAYFDADDFHPPANISKMSAGEPLTDADRWPWLDQLNRLIGDHLNRQRPLVLSCSALKRSYRERLLADTQGGRIIYLEGSYELILARMQSRQGHYMRPDMLQSQFKALEPPKPDEDVWTIRIDREPEEIIVEIATALF